MKRKLPTPVKELTSSLLMYSQLVIIVMMMMAIITVIISYRKDKQEYE
jgi:hypothetical protein